MKFKELQDLADKVKEKTKKTVFISVEYWNHVPDDRKKIEYGFWQPRECHVFLKTSRALKQHMENILSPDVDEGVELDEKEEECQKQD